MHDLIPEAAPFNPSQRAWLNGFMAGLIGMEQSLLAESVSLTSASAANSDTQDVDHPWHDPTLSLDERLKLAENRSPSDQMMASLGQLDCGQCGYLCSSYAQALSCGADADFNKCVPGGRPTAKTLKILLAKYKPDPANAAMSGASLLDQQVTSIEKGYHRDRPILASLIESRRLNSLSSEKATHHVAFKLLNPIEYSPGDAMGVWPMNNPEEVELIIAILKGYGSERIPAGGREGDSIEVREALLWRRDLRVPPEKLFRLLSEHAKDYADRMLLKKLSEDDTRAPDYGVHDVLDCLMEFRSARPPLKDFVCALSNMQPRLYSIASSAKAHPEEVHLTVGLVEYKLMDHSYRGIGSNYLIEQLKVARNARVFIQKSHGFKLPVDPDASIIMVGPGTGIAPFRAFLEERVATQAKGMNWLFFGNQKFSDDFLYQNELEALVQTRELTRLSTAFSRDQADKIYVQHRMLEGGAELWRWLNNGAYIYVCGDAKRMAGDVDLALQQIAQQHGGLNDEQVKGFITGLTRAGRYQRDVY